MRQRLAGINHYSVILLALLSANPILAASPGFDPLSSMTQIPEQQFVTADDTSVAPLDPAGSAATTVADPTIPLQPNPAVGTVIPVTPNQVQPVVPLTRPLPGTQSTQPGTLQPGAAFAQTISPPSTNLPLAPPITPTPSGALPPATEVGGQAVPLSPDDAAQLAPPQFVGGIDTQSFIYCSRLSTVACNRATNDATYRSCLSTITQPACRQFMTFAATAGFNRGDTVDASEHYAQGQLDLVHVKRYGINYPGDYYVVGGKGNFYNITSGPEAQAINIKANPGFANIQQRFSQAQLWSIVEQAPRAEALGGGGLRLVFRFKILNGCPTCETAGYANVAYDFSGDGVLRQVQLLSLDAT